MKQIIKHLRLEWYRYAFDTLVVIVGILIAFTLNNWNEGWQQKKAETVFLEQLHTEFLGNKEQLGWVVDSYQRAMLACEKFKAMFPIDLTNVDKDTLVYYFDFLTWNYTFNPSQGAINSIVNTASYSVISSLELRSIIVSWHDILADYLEDEARALKFLDEKFEPYVLKYLDIDMSLDDPRVDLHHLETKEFENLVKSRMKKIGNVLGSPETGELAVLTDRINRIIELTSQKD